MPQPPFIACRVTPTLPDEVSALSARLQARIKESQAATAGRLITEASCDLVDAFFGNIIRDMLAQSPDDHDLKEAHAVIEEVKSKLRHYLGWITGFFSNERLAPVVAHYASLLTHLPDADGVPRAHLAFSISPALAADSQASLAALHDPATTDIRPGVEVLIRVIEEALVPLVHIPKQRMKFNFLVDKTLDGVIAVTNALVFRSFRKLGVKLPKPLFPLVADHLGSFLHAR